MTGRAAEIERFLAGNGQASAFRARLAGDASARRYERLRGGLTPAILMDAPPEIMTIAPFVRIAGWLRQQGFSAPRIFASEIETGLALMEDLGDDLFSKVLRAEPERAPGDLLVEEIVLYGTAIDVLLALQDQAPPDRLPPYDDARMLAEVGLLTDWYARRLGKGAKRDYLEIWRDLLPAVRVGQDVFVYVDYHADNLLWYPERDGLERVGLLDFQDARLGPPAYDLVSLLEDARRDVPRGLAKVMIQRYLSGRPNLDDKAFRTAYAVLGAQRNCKILGLFSRLAARDGKNAYLALQDRVLRHLRRDLAHPRLAPLAAWFDRHVELNIAS
jgi:aminoglycoside/choline kinase family phosphotransferase